MKKPCRHRRSWAIAGGYWLWCYECGAIRLVGSDNAWRRWVKPVGEGGGNPWPKVAQERTK